VKYGRITISKAKKGLKKCLKYINTPCKNFTNRRVISSMILLLGSYQRSLPLSFCSLILQFRRFIMKHMNSILASFRSNKERASSKYYLYDISLYQWIVTREFLVNQIILRQNTYDKTLRCKDVGF
jgi:hypothetical protein